MEENERLIPLKEFSVKAGEKKAFEEEAIRRGEEPKEVVRRFFRQYVNDPQANAVLKNEAEMEYEKARKKKERLRAEGIPILRWWLHKHTISLFDWNSPKFDMTWKRELYAEAQVKIGLTYVGAEELMNRIVNEMLEGTRMPVDIAPPEPIEPEDTAAHTEACKKYLDYLDANKGVDPLDKRASPKHKLKENDYANESAQWAEHERVERELDESEGREAERE